MTTLRVSALALALLLAGGALAAQQMTPAPASTPDVRIKALVVSGGCCHDYVAQAGQLMASVNKALPVDWTIAVQGTTRESRIPLYAEASWISGFDIVVHNECYGFVDDHDYIARIVDAHKATGTPAVVTHCSMHSYRNATIDDWREFLGVTSRRHTAAHPIAVTWTQPSHAVTTGLMAGWTTPVDELYVIEKTWPGTTVLATAVSPEEGNPTFPVAWTNTVGAVRVFGTTLGHQDSWTDPVFQQLLAKGFAWALGR